MNKIGCYRESQKLARLGHYSLNILTGQWESSDNLNKVLGIDWNYQTDFLGWENLIHPSQRGRNSCLF